MKGALVAISITFSLIASSLSWVSVAYQYGIYRAADLTEARERWQHALVSTFQSISLFDQAPYKLHDDKFKTQSSALNLVALLTALPVFLTAPLVIFRRRSMMNVYIGVVSLLLAVSAVAMPFAWAYCLGGLILALGIVKVWMRPWLQEQPMVMA